MLTQTLRFWDYWYDRRKDKEARMQALIRRWEVEHLMVPGHRCSGHPWAYVTVIVFERDGKQCIGCGETDWMKLEIHHIIPLSAGGDSMPKNLKTLCVRCHDIAHTGAGGKYRRMHIAAQPGQTNLTELAA